MHTFVNAPFEPFYNKNGLQMCPKGIIEIYSKYTILKLRRCNYWQSLL